MSAARKHASNIAPEVIGHAALNARVVLQIINVFITIFTLNAYVCVFWKMQQAVGNVQAERRFHSKP